MMITSAVVEGDVKTAGKVPTLEDAKKWVTSGILS
jgi:deoxyribose-phosphate aldolase